jgi:hypothetical protein
LFLPRRAAETRNLSPIPHEGDAGLGRALCNPDHTGGNNPYITAPTSSQVQIGGDRFFS